MVTELLVAIEIYETEPLLSTYSALFAKLVCCRFFSGIDIGKAYVVTLCSHEMLNLIQYTLNTQVNLEFFDAVKVLTRTLDSYCCIDFYFKKIHSHNLLAIEVVSVVRLC